jgi:O-antigen/teichoic acid export membrane protein
VIAAISQILRSKLAQNALSLYALQGLNFLVPLILLPYLLRVLSADGYGAIAFAQSFIGYALILTDFGFNLTAARDISIVRNDPHAVAKVFWTTMFAKAYLLALSILVTVAAIVAIPMFRRNWELYMACELLLIGNAVFPAWYYQGMERLREMAVIQAVSKCAVAALVFAFVSSPRDELTAALLMSSPQFMTAAAALLLRVPLVPSLFYRPAHKDVKDALRESSSMFFATASTSLYLHTNTFVLGLMANERQVAYYSVGNRLIQALQGLTSPITQALFPRASILFASDRNQAWRLMRRTAHLLLPVMGLGALLIAILAPQIVAAFAGGDYRDAASVMRIMAPVPLFVTLAALLSQTIMVNLNLTKYLWRIYIVVGLQNLVSLPIVVHFWAADGAAVALVISELIGPLMMIAVLRRQVSSFGAGTRSDAVSRE